MEIQKKEERAKLEVIQIQAEQKVAEAKAKEQQIKLSGAMSEQERIRLEIEKETKIGVAREWAKGLSSVKLPETLMVNGGTAGTNSPVNDLINLMTIKEAKNLKK